MKINQVQCIRCPIVYEFGDKWFEKNDTKTFVCRRCKIIEKTRSKEFKDNASKLSKEKLSDPNVKSMMSSIASINNFKNSGKISESLKIHYSDKNNITKLSETVRDRWKNQEYREKVSKSIKEKWKSPEYRGKILGGREKLMDAEIVENFKLGLYYFDLLIKNVYLYDKKFSKEKDIFIKHNFPKYKYISDLAEAEIFGN